MEILIQKFSQQSQIKFIKLNVIVREDENFTTKDIKDIQIYQVFKYHNKDLNKSLEHIKKIVEWRRKNPETIREIANLDTKKIDDILVEQGLIQFYYSISKKGNPVYFMKLCDKKIFDIVINN